MDYVIRPLTTKDEPILWEMLYQGLHTSEGATVPQAEIAQHPELVRHVEGWGRAGDTGFVAHDKHEKEQFLGAVWLRSPKGNRKEHAEKAERIAELAFAVKPGHRRLGIGAALLTYLVKANPDQSTISMSVSSKNPAVRLYERFGFKIVSEMPGSVIMRRDA